ncbi:MAG: M20/M25/M40 family metallo-hydrolase, partial [Nitrospinota bacterium]|nr:M20/M25/M40 family metallo-hydrolase [Nitrospinota bacterium]
YDDVTPLTEKEEELVRLMKPYDGAERKKKFDLRRLALDLPDEELPRRHLTNPSFNIAGMDAGYTGEGVKTIVSGRARAKIDCRLVVDQDPEKIRDCVRRHLDRHGFEDIEVELLFNSLPAKCDPESITVKACQEASRRVYDAEAVINPFGSGSTPTWMVIRNLGIPLVGTGVGYITARTHSANENLKVEHLINGAKYMAAICESFGNA